jgi:predicted RNA binding protein YcfA (HicA-like mRNA interferase family)
LGRYSPQIAERLDPLSSYDAIPVFSQGRSAAGWIVFRVQGSHAYVVNHKRALTANLNVKHGQVGVIPRRLVEVAPEIIAVDPTDEELRELASRLF